MIVHMLNIMYASRHCPVCSHYLLALFPGDSAWEAIEQEAAISERQNKVLGPGTDQRWQELSWEGLHELQMSGKAVQVISLEQDTPAALR